jgi:hypothetical protein
MIIQHGEIKVIVEHMRILKPISIDSQDPTDFIYKKYIRTRETYSLEVEGEAVPIPEAVALDIIKDLRGEVGLI